MTLLHTAGCSDTGQSDGPRAGDPIFRFVQTFTDTIRLGESLSSRITVPRGDTIVGLPPGSFSDAERIQVVLSPSGLVEAVIFDYGLDVDFEAMVADYVASLGPAERQTLRRAGEEPADVAVWRDERTEFRIIRDPNRSAWTVRSVLRNRGRSDDGAADR